MQRRQNKSDWERNTNRGEEKNQIHGERQLIQERRQDLAREEDIVSTPTAVKPVDADGGEARRRRKRKSETAARANR
ncbi:unnamed protein product [Cochlearia groenlandica]